MALVGFDDISIAKYVDPRLTTVRLPAFDLGWRAARLCLQLVERENGQEMGTLLPVELVIRDSCGMKH
jgi:DNA-binding LacI/PurR family transcriptional regulator